MLYGNILSFIVIFYAKKYVLLFIKSLIYSIPTMVSTHSSTKDKKMVFSKEISDYFTKLVEPLVTMERLEEMFGKLKDETIQRFKEKFTAKNEKIVDLEEKIALQEKKIENLSIKCDDNEQYSRRYCLRMHGLKFDKNESQNDLFLKFLNVLVKSAWLTRKRR